MLRIILTALVLVTGCAVSAQRFDTECTSVTSDPKTTYKKYKRMAEKSGQAIDKEKYAAVLKFYQETERSNQIFSDLLVSGDISEDGQIEYLQTLARAQAWSRFAEAKELFADNAIESEENAELIDLMSRLEEGTIDDDIKTYECYTFDAAATLSGAGDLDIYWLIDGKKRWGAVVEKCFREAGEYPITLSSADGDMEDAPTDTTFVIQVDPPPSYQWAPLDTEVQKGAVISLTDPTTDSHWDHTVLWNMGNGTFFTGGDRVYTYPVAGNYQVRQYLIPPSGSNEPIVSHVTTVTVLD